MLKLAVILTLVSGFSIELAEACPTEDPNRSSFCKYDLYLGDTPNGIPAEARCGNLTGLNIEHSRPTTFLVNGAANANTFLSDIRTAIFNGDKQVNLISVDWRYESNEYDSNLVLDAGVCLANFINAMITAKPLIKLENIHIVGFSLGAHVAGNAGSILNREIGRITGLDPSGKIKSINLRKGQAKYVEVIHTDGGPFGNGIGEVSGDADFFANNGKSQPGCLTHTCCHNRAYELFAESLKDDNELEGIKCESKAQIDLNLCRGPQRSKMGNNDVYRKPSGMFRVNTKSK